MQSEFLQGIDCRTAAENQKRQLGCTEPLPIPYQIVGYTFDRCPGHYYKCDPEAFESCIQAVEVWSWKERGYLPGDKAWDDLPNKTIEACEFIDFLQSKKAAAGAARGRANINGNKPQRH